MYSGVFVIVSSVLTILVPDITTVLSVVGGIGCVAICYLVPLLAYLSVFPDKKIKCMIFIVIGSLLAAIGSASAINGVLKNQ